MMTLTFCEQELWKRTTPELTFPHSWKHGEIPQLLYIYQAFQGRSYLQLFLLATWLSGLPP